MSRPEQPIAERMARFTAPQPDGCWWWTGHIGRDGYGSIKYRGKTEPAHRLALCLALGERLPTSVFACHTCHVKRCVNPDHLYAGDVRLNALDCARVGGYSRKLTADSVIEIVAMDRSGVPAHEIAARFGISSTTVNRILTGHLWGWLTLRGSEVAA